MDIFFLQLVLLFIPGIIWERLDSRFGVNRPNAQFDIIRRAFCFGLSSYAVMFVIVAAINGMGHLLHPDQHRLIRLQTISLEKDTYTLNESVVGPIVGASVAALLLAILWLYASNYKIGVRLMQRIGATRKFGDEDVWDFTFNSRRAEVEYVHIRDFENDLTYSGWVEVFSETGKTRELILRNVIVSAIDGSSTYETPRLYIARPMDKMTIEFPYMSGQTKENADDFQSSADRQPTPGADDP